MCWDKQRQFLNKCGPKKQPVGLLIVPNTDGIEITVTDRIMEKNISIYRRRLSMIESYEPFFP